jgi:hypothetical protein
VLCVQSERIWLLLPSVSWFTILLLFEIISTLLVEAELQKNSTKAAKAKATREANSARTSQSTTSAENDIPGQGPPLNGHRCAFAVFSAARCIFKNLLTVVAVTLGGHGSSVSTGVLTTPTPMFNYGQPVNFQSQAPPFHWAMGAQHSPAYNMNAQYNVQGTGQMSLLEELNNPNVLYHPGQLSGEHSAVLQTRNMNQDQGLGSLEVSTDGANKNIVRGIYTFTDVSLSHLYSEFSLKSPPMRLKYHGRRASISVLILSSNLMLQVMRKILIPLWVQVSM